MTTTRKTNNIFDKNNYQVIKDGNFEIVKGIRTSDDEFVTMILYKNKVVAIGMDGLDFYRPVYYASKDKAVDITGKYGLKTVIPLYLRQNYPHIGVGGSRADYIKLLKFIPDSVFKKVGITNRDNDIKILTEIERKRKSEPKDPYYYEKPSIKPGYIKERPVYKFWYAYVEKPAEKAYFWWVCEPTWREAVKALNDELKSYNEEWISKNGEWGQRWEFEGKLTPKNFELIKVDEKMYNYVENTNACEYLLNYNKRKRIRGILTYFG